jgi:hypothetical protein
MTDGALLLDKPPGISSNRALQEARKLFGMEKRVTPARAGSAGYRTGGPFRRGHEFAGHRSNPTRNTSRP